LVARNICFQSYFKETLGSTKVYVSGQNFEAGILTFVDSNVSYS